MNSELAPGCTNLADGFEGSLLHLNKRDVTFSCFSRGAIDRLVAYKGTKQMGWRFPYVSTYGTDYHTCMVTAPDPFVAPYFNFLLDRAPKPQPGEPLNFRKDEYPD
jgi:predicted dithiol-disulfide oxidoreductase (DUF899 family)